MDANTLYLIVARDNLTRRTLLERLLAEKLPGDQDRRLGFLRIDPVQEDGYEGLLRLLSAPLLFASARMIAFDKFPSIDGKSKGVRGWEKALLALPARTTVVFLAEEPIPDNPLFSFVLGAATVIDGDRQQKSLWGARLKGFLDELGGSVSTEAKRFLWEHYKYDTLQACYELEKMLLTGQENALPPPGSVQTDAFEVLRMLEQKNPALFKETAKLYSNASSAFSVLGALVWQVRQNLLKSNTLDNEHLKNLGELEVALKTSRFPKALVVELNLARTLLQKGRPQAP
jgi:DNA polymerase III delta subunit